MFVFLYIIYRYIRKRLIGKNYPRFTIIIITIKIPVGKVASKLQTIKVPARAIYDDDDSYCGESISKNFAGVCNFIARKYRKVFENCSLENLPKRQFSPVCAYIVYRHTRSPKTFSPIYIYIYGTVYIASLLV